MTKAILLTGSTDGIGKLAATRLAKEGNEIYLHGRNADKLDAAISEIKTLSGHDKIKGFLADFSHLNSVVEMTERIKTDITRLDVLINNAGIFNTPVSSDKNGVDIRFTVNYLAPFLLTNRLLPLLQKGNNPRIINLGSAAQATVDLGNLSANHKLRPQEAYAQSKLAITMWTFFFAQEHQEITSIVVNPGSLLDTKMAKEAYNQVWSPATKGSDILCDLATSLTYLNHSGEYFDNDKGGFGPAHPDAYDSNLIKQLAEKTYESIIL